MRRGLRLLRREAAARCIGAAARCIGAPPVLCREMESQLEQWHLQNRKRSEEVAGGSEAVWWRLVTGLGRLGLAGWAWQSITAGWQCSPGTGW